MNSGNKADLELYLEVIKSMPYGVIISDGNGEFVFWNERASYIMQTAAQAINQQDWVDKFGVYSLDRKTSYKTEDLPLSKALKGETINNEKLYIKNRDMKDGIYINVNAFPVTENGRITAAVSMFDDITKEQGLYESVILKISDLETYLKELIKTKHMI